MTEVDMPKKVPPEPSGDPQTSVTEESGKAMKLVAEMLAGNIVDIRPQLDFTSQLGFFYPYAESVLEVKGEEVVSILEALANREILKRSFFEKLLRCPQCQSVNLRPSQHCPRCAAGNIARGRILEHFVCKHVGLEDEYISRGRYVCPECKQELRTIGSDYQSLGLLYKCRDCDNVFNQPTIKWRCLECSALTPQEKIPEINIYSYSFNEERRSWLEFELKPKRRLIDFLKQRGYEVTENATVKGRSGAEHKIDILATRDDGVVTYKIAIGVKVAEERIGLHEIFDFDDTVYESGIHDKVLVVVPGLQREAEKFASLQRIKVLEVRDLETVLASAVSKPSVEKEREPFEFKSKSQLIEYLKKIGYQVEENAKVQGKSGAKHTLDVLATRDDGLVTHHIAIGVEVAEKAIELEKVFDFDDKAYDSGILDKVFIAIPGLTREAAQFAQRQKIRVFEVKELEPAS